MRLVLDTSVLIASFRSDSGASRRLMHLIPSGKFQLVASSSLFFEYETVLKRSVHADIHGLSDAEIDSFLLLLAGFVDKPTVYYRWRPQLNDPDDELVLEAAISGQADAIVTHNVSDFLPAAYHFGIHVLTPGSILKERFVS